MITLELVELTLPKDMSGSAQLSVEIILGSELTGNQVRAVRRPSTDVRHDR